MKAFLNCDLFTGDDVMHDRVLVTDGGRIARICSYEDELVQQAEQVDLGGATLAPGFIDLQVNGGGGVLFNDDVSAEGIVAIRDAHRRFGTTGFLPTFITGPAEQMATAAKAVAAAIEGGVEEVLGIHFEGPHISPTKKGVHDEAFIRGLDVRSLIDLIALSKGTVLITLAPEECAEEDIGELARVARVAIGHTNADFGQAVSAARAGASLVTHTFNAMTALEGRAPGVVGAALAHDDLWISLIGDGHHVAWGSLRVAWLSKPRGKCILVTDAMPPVGQESGASYRLGDLAITLSADRRCVTADGTLAGSALDMAAAVRNVVQHVGIPKDEALRMATAYPAEYLGVADSRGYLREGYRADLVVLDNQMNVQRVFVNGEQVTTD